MAIVVVLGSGSVAPRVGSLVVSMDNFQTGNGSKMGMENVSMYTMKKWCGNKNNGREACGIPESKNVTT